MSSPASRSTTSTNKRKADALGDSDPVGIGGGGGRPAVIARLKDVTSVSDPSPTTPHIPPPVWGRVLDFMPYEEVRSALLVGKIIANEAVKYVRTLNLMKGYQLDVPSARRFAGVEEVNCLCLISGRESVNNRGNAANSNKCRRSRHERFSCAWRSAGFCCLAPQTPTQGRAQQRDIPPQFTRSGRRQWDRSGVGRGRRLAVEPVRQKIMSKPTKRRNDGGCGIARQKYVAELVATLPIPTAGLDIGCDCKVMSRLRSTYIVGTI